MNKKIIIAVTIGVLCILFTAVFEIHNNTIFIIEDKSYFIDFVVSEDKVYLNCKVMICNSYDYDKIIELYAYDYEDVKGGLLKNEVVQGINKDTLDNTITIKPGMNLLEISFVGEFNYNYQKINRNLPKKIEIKEVN